MLHPHSVFNYKTTPSQSTSHHYQHAVLTQSSSRQNTAVSLLHTTTSTLCSHSAFKQTKHSCQSTSHHYQHTVLTLSLQADKTQLSVHFAPLPACVCAHIRLFTQTCQPTNQTHLCTFISKRFKWILLPASSSSAQLATGSQGSGGFVFSCWRVRVALINTTAIVTMQQTTTHSTPQATQHTACTQHALVSSIYITLGIEVEIFSSKSTFHLLQLHFLGSSKM